ncbi:MAG: acetylglutamate kinase [Eubacteriaceae bacterium]|nr:acetylglutamate kinase [Eubacteriaceae bacterium]
MQLEFTNHQRAQVLVDALPHIMKYNDKIIVVKYGGNAMTDPELKEQVMEDIVLLSLIGVKIVLVHGGGPEINEVMNRYGKEAQFVDGLRVTDKETIDIVQMVLAGKVNKTLVNLLESKGGSAMGISGMDGRLLEAKIRDERLGYVGDITNVNIKPVNDLLEKGYIPVISTIACDRDGNSYNINGDTAAAHIAGALNAERLIMMTDVAGILTDKDDPSTLLPEVTTDDIEKLKMDGIVQGGMIPKVDCCVEAIRKGVEKVVIMDGRVPHSILMELLTYEGAGTMVTGGKID